jgi:nicotinamide-nucleotide amidase
MKREATKLIKQLQHKGLTLALAESMTCGLASYHLGIVKGTMDVFKGSVVCYCPEVKTNVLGVRKRLIRKFTPESQQVTDAMAMRLSKLLDAEIFGAVTGLAAKGGSETAKKPVGTVFLTVLFRDKIIRSRKLFRGTPAIIIEKACRELYQLIEKIAD